MKTNETKITDWHGCYDDGWNGLVVPEAFQHPAKFSYSLVMRIVGHGIEQGYWKPGNMIGDPFGGVALGGIVCGYYELNWIGVELESEKNDPPGSPFVEIGNRNIDLHRERWTRIGRPVDVRIVQGDSRRFAEVVGQVSGVVSSPPYAEGLGHGGEKLNEVGRGDKKYAEVMYGRYGRSDGQIEQLPTGSLDAVVTSPPFLDARSETTRSTPTKHGGDCADRHRTTQAGHGYGESSGQIGALKPGDVDAVITSPTYAGAGEVLGSHNGIDYSKSKTGGRKSTPARVASGHDYGDSEGQIASLSTGSLSGVATSPPWEKNAEGAIRAEKFKDPSAFAAQMSAADGKGTRNGTTPESRLAQMNRDAGKTYGKSQGQLGNESGETYWQAMYAVYSSMYIAMKPGAVAAIVVKDYVKSKERVPLCDQTCLLLESIGFEVFERCRCWLVKEKREPSLFGGEHVTTIERKSFFRRLAEKRGSPRIDWEETIWCRRPA